MFLQTDIDGTTEERNAAVYGQTKGGEEKGDDDDDDIQEQKIIKWRVENSWGTEKGDKGYLAMSDEWFNEYVTGRFLPLKKFSDHTNLSPFFERF